MSYPAYYDWMRTIAHAIADSAEIATHCIETYGRGCLVRLDDLLVSPPTDADAPIIIVTHVGRDDVAIGEDEVVIRLVAGVTVEPTVTVLAQRDAHTNGLETVGAASALARLLSLAADVARATSLGGAVLVTRIEDHVDGMATPPLQVGWLDVVFTQPKTLEE